MMGAVLVQIAEPRWTMQAVHLASAMSRNTGSQLVFLQLIRVAHIGLLGADLCGQSPTLEQETALSEFVSVAEDYGVEVGLLSMQYDTLHGALAQAAEYAEATALFACLPDKSWGLYGKYQRWSLRQELNRLHCALYTLSPQTNTQEWMPSVSLKAAK
jgi:hypothetical protein